MFRGSFPVEASAVREPSFRTSGDLVLRRPKPQGLTKPLRSSVAVPANLLPILLPFLSFLVSSVVYVFAYVFLSFVLYPPKP